MYFKQNFKIILAPKNKLKIKIVSKMKKLKKQLKLIKGYNLIHNYKKVKKRKIK